MTVALTSVPRQRQRRVEPLRRTIKGPSNDPLSVRKITPNHPVSFKRNEKLSFVHHSLWRIHAGHIRTLTWSAEGEFVPLGFWGVGDVVGYPVAQTHPYEARCLGAVDAEPLNVSYPLSREMLLAQVRQSNSLLQISHCRQSEQRILQFICWLAEHFGQTTAEGIRIRIRLTHQEIAESVGTTRVTVTRLLKSLEQKGCIIWKTNQKVVFQATFDRCYMHASRNYRP
ncbi:MAG: Crp/Fnr family transcriptional regulator [Cyanobacteria bacterium J06648_10]